jgi:hypothetical protein
LGIEDVVQYDMPQVRSTQLVDFRVGKYPTNLCLIPRLVVAAKFITEVTGGTVDI